jgi:flavin-dependent dehydrogenase
MPDVLIAGGGVAGSSLAIMLGRRGVSVELFEAARFPREKACGEGLMPAGVAVLDRLGMSAALGGAPFEGVRYHFGGNVAVGRFPAVAARATFGLGQRRKHLDELLLNAAAATPGAAVHSGVRVDAPIIARGRVTGLMAHGREHRAELVVAADGVHSRIRHSLGLDVPARRKRFGVRAHFQLRRGVSQPRWVDIFLARGHELYVTPLPNNEVVVAALADARPHLRGGTADSAFHQRVGAQPELSRLLDGATQVTPLLGMSPLSGRARAGFAPGLVLLGDAAGFSDPITGGGMTQALMTAELLADYIVRESRPNDLWLEQFDRERRSMLRDYELLTQFVLFLADRPPLAHCALSVLRAWPRLFSHLLGVSGGSHRLFTPLLPAPRFASARI